MTDNYGYDDNYDVAVIAICILAFIAGAVFGWRFL